MAAHQNEAPPGRPLLESGPVGWLRHRRRKHPPRAGAPEAFADDRIDWETLREALGDYLDDDGAGAEHFGLFWPGKRQARRLASTPSKSTLIPVAGEGVKAIFAQRSEKVKVPRGYDSGPSPSPSCSDRRQVSGLLYRAASAARSIGAALALKSKVPVKWTWRQATGETPWSIANAS